MNANEAKIPTHLLTYLITLISLIIKYECKSKMCGLLWTGLVVDQDPPNVSDPGTWMDADPNP